MTMRNSDLELMLGGINIKLKEISERAAELDHDKKRYKSALAVIEEIEAKYGGGQMIDLPPFLNGEASKIPLGGRGEVG